MAFKQAGSVYYIHTSHLDYPLAITDSTGTIVWQASHTPFGEIIVETNQLSSTFTPRFPGQYYDDESGLFYNYFRDYDPELGRYIQSDRLGLYDGPNTYGYAHQNPIMKTDPTGEFVPQLLGFAIGAGLENFTNECASLGDIMLAGGLGAFGGALGKIAFLKHGPKSLTRVTGKEWSHSVSRKTVNKFTDGRLKKLLNKRGGINGSWTSPKRHYIHDCSRYPKGWREMGRRLPKPLMTVDRTPDWLKGSIAAGAIGSAVVDSECGCN